MSLSNPVTMKVSLSCSEDRAGVGFGLSSAALTNGVEIETRMVMVMVMVMVTMYQVREVLQAAFLS